MRKRRWMVFRDGNLDQIIYCKKKKHAKMLRDALQEFNTTQHRFRIAEGW